MPYEVKEQDGSNGETKEFQVINSETGEVKASYMEKATAERQVKLLNHIEDDPEWDAD